MKKIRINFIGKDSVPYDNTIEVPDEIYAALQEAKARKNPDPKTLGQIFPKANAGTVKLFLNEVQKGISPKNLRTVVCNEVLINNLKAKNITKANTENEKIRAIFEANLEIAKTLNHQKNVSKTYKEAEGKVKERVQKTKDRLKLVKANCKTQLKKLDEKKAKYKELFKGQKLLKEKLAEIEEQKIKITARLERAQTNIGKAEFALDKKQLTKDIALGTSLASYADPQLLYSYLKYIDLPVSKIYTPAVQKAFAWAEGVDENYWRTYPS